MNRKVNKLQSAINWQGAEETKLGKEKKKTLNQWALGKIGSDENYLNH